MNLNKYEKAISDLEGLAPDTLKAFTAVHSACEYDGTKAKTIWNTSACVIGPSFFFFIWWILEEAEKKGIERLYFFARDGQIFLKIAEIIKDAWDYKIEFKYLYASREAWQLPAVADDIGDFDIDWIMFPLFGFLSVSMVFKRLKIDMKRVADLLKKNGFKEKNWDRKLNDAEKELLADLIRSGEIKTMVKERSGYYFEKVFKYLDQEKVFINNKCAFVDIGWRGRLLFSLSRMMKKRGKRPLLGLLGFYFGLDREKMIYPGDSISSFLFDIKTDKDCKKIYIPALYEIFAAADHGRTIEFEMGDKYVPVFDDDKGRIAREWGVELQQEGIQAFAKYFTRNKARKDFDLCSARKIARKLNEVFIDTPSMDEAETYGQFVIAAGQLEDLGQEIAPKINYRTFIMRRPERKQKSVWPQASFIRSDMPVLCWIWKMMFR